MTHEAFYTDKDGQKHPWVAGGTTTDIRHMFESIPAGAHLWLTEQGPVMLHGHPFPGGSALDSDGNPTFSREAYYRQWASNLPKRSWWPRVRAVNFYEWSGDGNWDSGMFGYGGETNGTSSLTAGEFRSGVFDAFRTLVMTGDLQ